MLTQGGCMSTTCTNFQEPLETKKAHSPGNRGKQTTLDPNSCYFFNQSVLLFTLFSGKTASIFTGVKKKERRKIMLLKTRPKIAMVSGSEN